MTDDGLRTPRLSLRRWRTTDLEPFAAMNADPEVMRWFPSALDREGSDAMVGRIETHWADRGFGLWAVEVLASERGPAPFVGFVGLAVPRFEPPFAATDPCVEIGWRLARPWWGLGLATEGAREVLRQGFGDLGLTEVVSFTVPPNLASQRVMQKLGLRYDGVFTHPGAERSDWWAQHVLYRLEVDAWRARTEASGRTSP
ncbi:GNAT family N-acetyltransferase [Longivirga aurantiaca]|uniref:GNAT family N-acetyltransferase n=1 Tax=Longivirga aurantiaca TaxID=1837743 RepID=A0ABW1T2Z3_9ACTN